MDPPRARSAHATLDAESARWLHDLRGRDREAACRRLHEHLLRIARGELGRRRRSPLSGPELDDLAHQAAADALLAIVAKLDQFRGESRFMTWAFRFVILEVSSKLGRHFWRHRSAAALDDEEWDRLPAAFGFDPQQRAEWQDLMGAMRRAVDEELTPHQRRIFVALVLHEVPLDALVVELGSNRNAVYKSLFDARRKLRRTLVANGYMHLDTSVSS